MQQILTPTGYRDIAAVQIGDEVSAFDIATGAPLVNTVESKAWVDLAEWQRWHYGGPPEAPPFWFVRVNDRWTLGSEQSIWIKCDESLDGAVATHAKHLEIGDTIYDDNDQPLVIVSLDEVDADGWWRFDISGDHSYICDGLTLHNASRFWFNGTGTWDSSTTAHWGSATNGSGAPASAPGSADTVTIDAASGAGTVTPDFSGFASSIGVFQTLTCGAMGMTLAFNTNNHSMTLSSSTAFNWSGSGTRSISLGSGVFKFTNNTTTTLWNMTTTTGQTWDAGTSTIRYSPSATGATEATFTGGALAYNNLTVDANTAGLVIGGANTFATVTIAGAAVLIIPNSATQTVTGVSISGGAASAACIMSNSATTAATISKTSGSVAIDGAGIRGITFSGGASFAATNSFDLGLNSGITITAPSASSGVVGIIGS